MNNMKSYFFRNVLNQIKSKKLEAVIVFSIAFMMSIFLSLIHFFGYNDSMEENIANQLDLSYEIRNSHVFTDDHINDFVNKCKNPYEYYEMILNWIENNGNDTRISEYQYDLVLKMKNESNISYDIFGTNDVNYLEDKEMILISGRFLSEAELKNGSNYIVISDQTYKDDKKTKYKVGDKIQLMMTSADNIIEVEVIGIYQYVDQSSTFNANDKFINSKGLIISNNLLDKYINNYSNSLNFRNFRINHIKFTIKDYKKYEEYSKDLEDSIHKLNNELEVKGYPISKLGIDENNVNEIIHATSRIKYVYQIVFILIFVVAAFMLMFSIYYLLKKKTREIAVYYSLGQSKGKIILHYFMTYILISIFAVILGLVIGYIISIILINNMAQDSIDMQSEILRFSMISVMNNIENNANIPTFTFTISACIKIFIQVIIIIGSSVITSIIIIMNDKILSRNGGWNS